MTFGLEIEICFKRFRSNSAKLCLDFTATDTQIRAVLITFMYLCDHYSTVPIRLLPMLFYPIFKLSVNFCRRGRQPIMKFRQISSLRGAQRRGNLLQRITSLMLTHKLLVQFTLMVKVFCVLTQKVVDCFRKVFDWHRLTIELVRKE